MRLLPAVILAAVILSGCLAPEVSFPGPGCGGALVAPEAVVSVAHCFARRYPPFEMRLPSGLDVYALPVAWNAGRDLVIMRPILQTGEPLTVWWPWYAEYQEPELGDLAISRGGCLMRDERAYRLRSVGEGRIEVTPYPIQPGIWDHWVALDNAVACPGDSGYPLWSVDGPADGVWQFSGLFSMWRGWGWTQNNGERHGMLVVSTGGLE